MSFFANVGGARILCPSAGVASNYDLTRDQEVVLSEAGILEQVDAKFMEEPDVISYDFPIDVTKLASGMNVLEYWIATFQTGVILQVKYTLKTAAAADESLVLDYVNLTQGQSVIPPQTIDNTTAVKPVVITPGVAFSAVLMDDIYELNLNYTPGVGPTLTEISLTTLVNVTLI